MHVSLNRIRMVLIGVVLGGGLIAQTSTASLAAPLRHSTGACSLPVTRDTNDGFRLGVPSGWDVFTLNGAIVASKDPTGREESIVYPAIATSGLKSSTFFNAYIRYLQKLVNAGGSSLTYTMTSRAGQLPAATISARSGGTTLTGRATTEILPYHSAHGSALMVFLGYWAPSSQFSGQQTQLAEIGKCYAPRPGTLYHIFHVQGDPFTFAMPLGWKDVGETSDTIDIDNANDTASAHYALTLVSSSEANSPPTLLLWIFQQLHVSVSRVLSSVRLKDRTLSNGSVKGEEYVEFLGTLQNGTAIHGIVYVLSVTGGGVTSGVMRLGISTPGLWNSVNGALIHIIGSIQHDFSQDLQTWEHVNQQWQQEEQNFQGFDDAINGVDLVEDPATGQQFEAPYSTYQQSGPDGPGYYSGSTKLQPITS